METINQTELEAATDGFNQWWAFMLTENEKLEEPFPQSFLDAMHDPSEQAFIAGWLDRASR